ncbi:MAG TPA: dihydrolipoamide acetyltransferase family protein, partial [Mycobacteriales bacterium]|nr:dihydrolipoamide acetyltransferase family protein [Mycobacteriales bacterium]
MSRVRDFKLPDLGEGLTEGEILQWMVKVGDTVTLNQPIVEVETAKAAVEVPSPFAGVVLEIHHEAGTTVDVGSPIITFDTDPSAGPLEGAAGGAAAGAAANPVESAAPRHASVAGTVSEVAADTVPAAAAGLVDASQVASEPGIEGSPAPKLRASDDDAAGPKGALIGEVGPDGRTATLVGYGPRSVTAKRRPRTSAPSAPAPTPLVTDAPKPSRIIADEVGRNAEARSTGTVARAKPPVRKLAKDLGVTLSSVRGTGPDGLITRDDVERAAGGAAGGPSSGVAAAVRGVAGSVDAGYDAATRERRVPVKGVRRLTAEAMVGSAFTAPHVTEFITLDMTPTMELRKTVAAMPEFAGVKVTPLLFVAKALLLAVSRNPEINASWDEDAQEIVVKDYVNLGIAAATPRGLMVPNVKDADQLSLPELAQALQSLTETAKQGKTPPADMQGGTITITNVGVFGVDNGTPILNPGEAAILCFGAVRPMPWVHEAVPGEQSIAVRQVTQLSLSFDHRMVDGQLGSQFLSDVARVLSDPAT